MGDVFFAATHPRARKPRKCELCNRWIAAGEVYRRQGVIYDGRAFTSIACIQCAEFCKVLVDAGFESDEGGWPFPAELDESEVAYVGLSREMQLFKERWQRDGVLVEFPSSPDFGTST